MEDDMRTFIRSILIACLIILSQYAIAQGWEYQHPMGMAVAGVQLPNNDYAVLGVMGESHTTETHHELFFLSQDGNLKNSLRLSNYSTEDTVAQYTSNNLLLLADGDLIFIGSLVTVDDHEIIQLTRLQTDGTIKWSTQIDLGIDLVYKFSSGLDANGNIYLSYFYGGTIYDINLATIIYKKIDQEGNLIWTKSIEQSDISGSIYTNQTNNTSVLADGSLITTVRTGNTRTSEESEWYFLHLDTDGNLERTIKVFDRLSFKLVSIREQELSSDNSLFITHNGVKDDTTSITTIAKYDFEGQRLWIEEVPSRHILDIVASGDGGVGILFDTLDFNLNPLDRDTFIRFDTNGTVIAENNFGRNGRQFELEKSRGIYTSHDDGFLFFSLLHTGTRRSLREFDMYLIKLDHKGRIFDNVLSGRIWKDFQRNCQIDSIDELFNGPSIITAQIGNREYVTTTDKSGTYQIQLPSSNAIRLRVTPSVAYWDPCQPLQVIQLNGDDTLNLDHHYQPIANGPLLRVNSASTRFRPCSTSVYTIEVCNLGPQTAEDAYLQLRMPPQLSLVGLTDSAFIDTDSTYKILLPDIASLDCYRKELALDVVCDPVVAGLIACIHVRVFPDSISTLDGPYRGGYIEVDGSCSDQNEIQFKILNRGAAATSIPIDYVVIEDHVIMRQGQVELDPGQIHAFDYSSSAQIVRLEAEQDPNFPFASNPTAIVIGCNDSGEANGFFTLPQGDEEPYLDTYCAEIVNSYDPNDKRGFPAGVGEENYIELDTEIEYIIRFQNTGTDTAYRVEIRDTLDSWLDLSSLRMGVSSHPMAWTLNDNAALSFTFPGIKLVDSTTNASGSEGFVSFFIKPLSDISLGTAIKNTASIYFDFNPPIVTNTTTHTIGENFLEISTMINDIENGQLLRNYPNPFSDETTIDCDGFSMPIQMDIYSINGSLVRTDIIDQEQYTFLRGNLESGIYIVRLMHQGKLVGQGKLLIQ